MHIPDGILSPSVWIVGDAVAALAVAWSAKRAGKQLTDRKIPLMGVLGAFVFAAQMINFPVPGGTSGHLLGGVMLAVLLGPAIANVVLFCVFVVQALMFQDGGITVLGLNFINMGLTGSVGGWMAARWTRNAGGWRRDAAIFLAGFVSVLVGSMLVALQLHLGNQAPLTWILVSMASVHVWVGIGEGILTVATLRFLRAAKPELLENPS